jgi:hypothetical protein
MPKFRVWAAVTGTKYLGEFEAETKEQAEEMALVSDAASVRLCHQCSDECEDPQCDSASAEPVED